MCLKMLFPLIPCRIIFFYRSFRCSLHLHLFFLRMRLGFFSNVLLRNSFRFSETTAWSAFVWLIRSFSNIMKSCIFFLSRCDFALNSNPKPWLGRQWIDFMVHFFKLPYSSESATSINAYFFKISLKRLFLWISHFTNCLLLPDSL